MTSKVEGWSNLKIKLPVSKSLGVGRPFRAVLGGRTVGA